jgi:hypothetical protein
LEKQPGRIRHTDLLGACVARWRRSDEPVAKPHPADLVVDGACGSLSPTVFRGDMLMPCAKDLLKRIAFPFIDLILEKGQHVARTLIDASRCLFKLLLERSGIGACGTHGIAFRLVFSNLVNAASNRMADRFAGTRFTSGLYIIASVMVPSPQGALQRVP